MKNILLSFLLLPVLAISSGFFGSSNGGGGGPGSDTTAWHQTGDAGTTAGVNYIGPNDAQDFVIKNNNVESGRFVNGSAFSVGVPNATLLSAQQSVPASFPFVTSTNVPSQALNILLNSSTVDGSANSLGVVAGDVAGSNAELQMYVYGPNDSATPFLSQLMSSNDLEVRAGNGSANQFLSFRVSYSGGVQSALKLVPGISPAAAETRFITDDGLHYVGLKAPDNANISTSYTMTLPIAQGGASTFLKNDGIGNLSWAAAGTVTSVDFAAPGGGAFNVSGNPITSSGTISLNANGNSGGVLYFPTNSTIGSSAALTLNQLILGGGPGSPPAAIGTYGAANTVLHGNSGTSPPTYAAVDLANDVTGILPVTHGGTSTNTLLAHSVIVGNGTSAITQLSVGLHGQVLVGQGTGTSDPTFSYDEILGANGVSAGTLAFEGSTSGTIFVKAQAAAGNFNFNLPTTAGTAGQVLTSQGGAGTAMTWTTVSGAPVAPTQQNFLSGTGTYTTPGGVLYLRVLLIGGGGGGGASGHADGGDGTDGVDTTFGAALLVGNHGIGGKSQAGNNGGAGGSFSLGGVTTAHGTAGGSGDGSIGATTTSAQRGGSGGAGVFGGYGGGGTSGNPGQAASANSGGGGGGGGAGTLAGEDAGAGGGAGGYVEAIITSPSATYLYTVGSAGTGGAAGTNGANGGNGAAGIIIVEEHYQ